ncbi:MAG: hypothetical protein IJ193_05005 [Bacilli bacterium]|nr:hypothetical protein [Bacilli bacterium]
MPHITKYLKYQVEHAFSRSLEITDCSGYNGEEVIRYFEEKCDFHELSPASVHEIVYRMSVEERLEFLLKNADYVSQNEQAILGYQKLGNNLFEGFQYKDFVRLSIEKYELFEPIITKCFFDVANVLDSDSIFKILIGHPNLFLGKDPMAFCHYFENIGEKGRGDCYTNKMKVETNPKIENRFTHLLNIYSDYISSFPEDILRDFFRIIEGKKNFKKFYIKNKNVFDSYLQSENPNFIGFYLLDIGYDKFSYFVHMQRDALNKFHFRDIYSLVSDEVLESIYLNDYEMEKLNTENTLFLGLRSDRFRNYVSNKKKDIHYEDVYPLDTFEIPIVDQGRLKRILDYYSEIAKSNFKLDGSLIELRDTDEIYSNAFFKNLFELKGNPNLDFSSTYEFFMKKIPTMILKKDTDDDTEYDILFRLLLNQKLTFRDLKMIGNYNQLIFFNRLRFLNIDAHDFSSSQLQSINMKRVRELLYRYGSYGEPNFDADEEMLFRDHKNDMIIKAYLLFGFKNANIFLEKCKDKNDLEHLIDKINVSNIPIDLNHEPIVNQKLNNLLFSDANVIDSLLENKDSSFYQYFPRLFNEWDGLDYYNKNVLSLRECIRLLEEQKIILPPRYEGIRQELRYIGSDSKTVEQTKQLYDEMLRRNSSTIPTVSGKAGDYHYEVLPYDDVKQLSVGAKTNCCFTPNGLSKDSLKQGVSSKNGRIFIVTKEDRLIAHSWMWRNGNLLCFDNIETAKGLEKYNFLSCYESAARKIVGISKDCENGEAIDVVTIGVNPHDDKIERLEDYDFYTNEVTNDSKATVMDTLPQPIEAPIYSDAKKTQRILKKGSLKLYQSNYLYYDKRINRCESYHHSKQYTDEEIQKMNLTLNSIMSRTDDTDHKCYDVTNYNDVYLGTDYAIMVDTDKNISIHNLNYDNRSTEEITQILQKIK